MATLKIQTCDCAPCVKQGTQRHTDTQSHRGVSHFILPDLGDLGARLADDAADELVGDGHLVGLVRAGRPALSGEQRQC